MLYEDSSSCYSRSARPGVNACERHVEMIQMHIFGIRGGQVGAQRLRFLAAIGAFEITELDDYDWSALVAIVRRLRGNPFQLVEIGLKRILRGFIKIALQDMLSVFRHIVLHVL